MPYQIKKSGSKWCVYKKGSSTPVPGGCHATKAAALKHMRALYANVPDASASFSIFEQREGIPYQDGEGIWHLDHVPIISTGISYPLSTGPTTFTEDQLSDAVKAYSDPAIKAPRIKLGHSSKYNAVLIGDAEQAFGRAENLSLEDNGQTIYGDYVGTPEWLTQVVAVAYPSRSIEGDFDVETNTGRSYKLVINAVSLLGVLWPGCSTLEDLPLFYGSTIPPGVEIEDPVALVAARNGGGMKPGEFIEAAADVDAVKRQFYAEVATGDNYWWWIRGIRYDQASGLQLIVDRDDGTLVRVPVEVEGSDVTFGDPVEVTEEYPDKLAAGSYVAGMAVMAVAAGGDMIAYQTRVDAGANERTGGTMDEATRQAMAQRLGLAEDATEDQINAEIGRLRTASESGGGNDDGDEQLTPEQIAAAEQEAAAAAEAERQRQEGGGDEQLTPEQIAAARGPVTLDRDTYNRLKQGADLAIKHESDSIAAAAAQVVDDAIKAGKFSPARREHYVKLMGADPEGTKQLIDGLEAGAIPIKARGTSGNGGGEGSGSGEGEPEGLPDEWFGGDLARIKAGHVPGRVGRVMNAKES